MNERIEELARQVGFNEYILENVWAHEQPEFNELMEKFAELIVQECINTLEFHGFDDAVPYIKWMATNKLGQHFGVEE